jgi:hypothetical protein
MFLSVHSLKADKPWRKALGQLESDKIRPSSVSIAEAEEGLCSVPHGLRLADAQTPEDTWEQGLFIKIEDALADE